LVNHCHKEGNPDLAPSSVSAEASVETRQTISSRPAKKSRDSAASCFEQAPVAAITYHKELYDVIKEFGWDIIESLKIYKREINYGVGIVFNSDLFKEMLEAFRLLGIIRIDQRSIFSVL